MKKLAMYTLFVALTLGCLVNTSQAADPSLIGHWPLDGDTLDYSGNERHGTMNGTATYVPGMVGQALELDGSSYVDCGNLPAYNVGENLTMAVWFNVPGFTKTWETILSKGDNSYRFGTNNSGGPHFGMNGPSGGWFNGAVTIDDGEWHHAACTYDGALAAIYIDGALDTDAAKTGAFGGDDVHPFYIGENAQATGRMLGGTVDDVQLYNRALSLTEVQSIMQGLGDPSAAKNPTPENEAVDVLRDTVLSWDPGEFPSTHNVYFGSSAEDVNSATVPDAAGLTDTSFDPGRLTFGEMNYWRVDEVNTSPDKTVYKGAIWSFQTEPYSIQIPGDTIAVTASSVSNEFSTANKTLDGSGLGADGTHNIASENMWFTAAVDLDPWIQYEFAAVEKLDTMKVWNSNSAAEMAIGWGVKDVEIAYSVDGENWDVLEGATQLNRAPGFPTYNQPDEIAFNGVAAKYVRLNIASNWGGILMSYGISEVQFSMIPAAARTPDPADGAVDVVPNAIATWRAGREAAQSTIYVSTDQNEVAEGLAPSITSNTNSADLSSLDLALSTTYYLRVDEVNEAEAISVWPSPVWSFATADAIVVDDFESYGNVSPDRPFQVWLDGFGYSADEFFPSAYGGNGTGAGIGHDIWSLASPYYNGDLMETSNTLPGSGKAMPFYYSNSGGTASETQRKFAVPQDWTVGGATILSIPFSGAAGNTGTLYAKINGTKVTYPRDAANLALGGWMAFNIDLSGMNVQSVTELAIGVDGSNASGVLLIDDITLHAEAGEIITPTDPGTDGLVASYSFEGNANDVSGNGNNGTVNGGAQFVTGRIGSALDCDGIDDYVSTDKVASQLGIGGNSPRTISSWVFTRSFNNGGIYDVGARVATQDFCLRTMAAENTWRIQYWGGDSDFTLDTASKWVHFTHVHDGVNTKIYANGVLLVDWAKTIDTPDTNPFQIGCYGWQNDYFDGMIDEVRVYNRALSEGEALSLAGGTAPIDKPF